MVQVISNSEIFTAAKKICQSPDEVYLAVSYWSGGASEALQIHKHSNVRVVLDVEAGGTSARELKKLMNFLGDRLRIHKDLHAKIYASKNLALVGSANASRPGLHIGRDGQLSNQGHAEAAALLSGSDAEKAFALAIEFFEEGEPANKRHISICEERFGERSIGQSEVAKHNNLSFAQLLIEQSELFDDMPFIITTEEACEHERNEEWKIQAPTIAPSEVGNEFDPKRWDNFQPKLDKRYIGKDCIALHVGQRRGLYVGYMRPSHTPEHRDWTFAERKSWDNIDAIKYRGLGGKVIDARDEREALLQTIDQLKDDNFVLGKKFINTFNNLYQ